MPVLQSLQIILAFLLRVQQVSFGTKIYCHLLPSCSIVSLVVGKYAGIFTRAPHCHLLSTESLPAIKWEVLQSKQI